MDWLRPRSERALCRSLGWMERPLRGRGPWLARALRMGQGERAEVAVAGK